MISPYERPTHQVEFYGPAGHPGIKVDGHELRTVTRARLTLTAEALPVLEVTLLPVDGISGTTERAYVLLDEATRRALAAMGWTPPGD